MAQLSFGEKISLIKLIASEVIEKPELKYRKINDLILFTEEPKDVDVVLKALQELCRVFLEIIPAYKLREDASQNTVDDETGANKGMKLSKEVKQLRSYEAFFLESYKKYLMTLEFFQKIKPGNLIHKLGIKDENKRANLLAIYTKIRDESVASFCKLLKRHPHFNFR